jgi:hypothetical protein
MKKLFLIAFAFLSLSAFAQKTNPVDKALSRFTDPDNPDYTTFLAKGGRAIGIGGSYRMFNVNGENAGDGYSILSILNIGEGRLHTWNVSPSYSWFVADDLSLGVRLNYTGYYVDTNIKLDFRDIIGSDDEALNVTLSNRHMLHHKVGAGFTARRYKSLFGSKMLGVFAEGRFSGSYGFTMSHPVAKAGEEVKKYRVSNIISLGLDIAGGLAVKLKDNSVLTLSIPIVGVGWNHSRQNKYWTAKDAEEERPTGGSATMDRFQISRNIDALGIQVGYVRYILPKKR